MSTKECFTVVARALLDPDTYITNQNPELHQALQTRLETAWELRNNESISRCVHTIFNGYEIGRTDGVIFQIGEISSLVDVLDPITKDTRASRVDQMCIELAQRVDIYGIIGAGTFGVVYLARERCQDANVNPYDLKHYAIKVERHTTYVDAQRYLPVSVVPIWDPAAENVTYIPTEALALFFLSHSDRFPKLDSVYMHGRFQSIVMSACVDSAADRLDLGAFDPMVRFPAFTGRYLLNHNGTPLLNEMQACRVAAQLLEGIVHMAEFNLVHNDMSVNNFVVDQRLNVQIIDLGNLRFGTKEADFISHSHTFIPFQEYHITPEMALLLLRREYHRANGEADPSMEIRLDLREHLIWKFGVIVYGMLHGFWPWDTPAASRKKDLLDWDGESNDRVNERRMRMLNEEVHISESLSNDCRDVLRCLFHKDPEQRPSLETLITFPWFSQWKGQDGLYERPFSLSFNHLCSEAA